jgi:hypothetical protein
MAARIVSIYKCVCSSGSDNGSIDSSGNKKLILQKILSMLLIRKRPIVALPLRSLEGSSFLTFIHFWSEKIICLGM